MPQSLCKVIYFYATLISRRCVNLTFLKLDVCTKISDNGLKEIATHCTKLNALLLNACDKITDASLQLVATNCSALEVLELDRTRYWSIVSSVNLKMELGNHSRWNHFHVCKKQSKFKEDITSKVPKAYRPFCFQSSGQLSTTDENWHILFNKSDHCIDTSHSTTQCISSENSFGWASFCWWFLHIGIHEHA